MTAILATTANGRRLRLEAALGDHVDPCATCPPDRPTRHAEVLIDVEPEGAKPGTTGRTLPVCGQCIADMLIAGLIAAQHATARLVLDDVEFVSVTVGRHYDGSFLWTLWVDGEPQEHGAAQSAREAITEGAACIEAAQPPENRG